MKIRVTFKDPDVADDAIKDAFKGFTVDGLSDEEIRQVKEIRKGHATEIVYSFMKYGEYITVEFDIDAKTATVVDTFRKGTEL